MKNEEKLNTIEIKGLEKSYKNFHLGPIDLEIPTGYIVGFIGENGAGKTTTIKLLLGLLKKENGSIKIFDKEFDQHRKEILQDIGFVFDELHFPENIKIKHINKIMQGIYKDWNSVFFENYCAGLNLDVNKKIKELSRGMKMKVSLAIALSHNAKLLLLDEPTGGLDPIVREEILDMLMDYMQDGNRTVILSSHILSDLEKIADYITFIHNGKIQFFEEKDRLTEELAILSCDDETKKLIGKTAIVAERKQRFHQEILVKKALLDSKMLNNDEISLAKPNIEDIMLFFSKGEK